jgi:hypothetical protein
MAATRYKSLKNPDLELPSARAIQLGYAIFILVLFSSLSFHVIYMTVSAIDNFESSYGS